MRIFSDFHHAGAAQGQILLLHARLGNDVYYPNDAFIKRISHLMKNPGDWLSPTPDWLQKMGGVPDSVANDAHRYIISYEEFMGMKWDAVLCTRYESQDIFKSLIAEHPDMKDVKIIGMTGNDCTTYDWSWMKNFMSCDELSYFHAPKDINKIWYSQEIGQHYGRVYASVTEQSLKKVNSFINCWPSFDQEWYWNHEFPGAHGKCPHCKSQDQNLQFGPVRPYNIYHDAMTSLVKNFGYQYGEYGINCRDGMIPEHRLPQVYASGALTIHMKTYDGYGYSMLQSIACGRPVIVPRGFFKYRTANKYLIPNLTCFEVEWSAEDLVDTVRAMTSDLDTASKYSQSCYRAAHGIFNWELEAFRIKKFMKRLI
jgi:hypothetical protein